MILNIYISNHRFKSLSIILMLLSAFSLSAYSNQENSKPNILVFVVDDLGYMDIGANNPECFYETPNIDALADSGMRFTDGYAANPVCSPTRYALMTGKYPSRVDATNFFSGRRSGTFDPAPLIDHMPLEEITIAQVLRSEGYATFFAGKWHLGESEEYYPQNRGFDINMGGHTRGGPYTGNKYFSPFENPQLHPDSPEGDHLPDRLARETATFINNKKGGPFLAYLSFYSVHTPLMGRPDLVEKYEQKAADIYGEEFGEDEQVFGSAPRKIRILQNHAVYAAMVEAMDEAIGKVLQQLEDSGVADNTIVIFTSDNGGLSSSGGLPTSNLPLRGGKGWVYEGGIREPWIVRYPGITEAGSVSDELVCSIDLFPTLATASGAEVSHSIDGVNLIPALKGDSLNRKSLFWHYPHYSNQGGIPGGAIREGDFKLFERYEDGRVHLYNLKDDISEQHDLANDYPEKVSAMRARLHAWYQDVDAKFLQKRDGGPKPWRPSYMEDQQTTKTLTSESGEGELPFVQRFDLKVGEYADDVAFMEKHTQIVLLKDGDSEVAVAPAYQGRVMTSTYDRNSGPSFGWINRPVIEKGFLSNEEKMGTLEEHIYIFGGEERFWLGPEGGQYALFFKPGTKFEFSDWKTPPVIDTESFQLVAATQSSATFKHNTELINYSGSRFSVGIERTVKVLDKEAATQALGVEIGEGLHMVAYETDNRITNTGSTQWMPESGLLSIWMLGMYNPSPNTTVVIPFQSGTEDDLGPKVNDTYFGKVPLEYLKVEDDILFFKGDGTRRGKIGITPHRSKGIAGSYDADGQVLNLVTYNVQEAPHGFVNSMWEIQKEPYAGDVINSYNDGSPEPGVAPLGPFYELETSSPAAALKPGEMMQHIQRTYHIQGTEDQLDSLAIDLLGVSLEAIKTAF